MNGEYGNYNITSFMLSNGEFSYAKICEAHHSQMEIRISSKQDLYDLKHVIDSLAREIEANQ